MGGRSSSSSSNTTINQDNRVAVQDGIGLANSNNNTIQITDGGIVGRALDTVDLSLLTANDNFSNALSMAQNASNQAIASANASAANAIAASNAANKNALNFADSQIGKALETVDTTLGDGFGRLLDISENMLSAGGDMIKQTQSTVAAAYADAQNTAKGTIDNRTMIILAVAGAAALVMIKRK
jgi:hypothetical protein